VATVLNIDPAVGRLVREARLRRGWTVDMLSAALGPLGSRQPYALGRTQLTRLEQGRRNVTAEEAWRLIELFDEPEFDAWEVLEAAGLVRSDSSPRFRAAVLEEAEARRRGAGNDRRWDRQIPAAEAVSVPGGSTTVTSNVIPGPWPDEGETGRKVA
jgi:transcriptional regulator with XRE-family HTH domain